ncbi:MAG: xanthine dehydrogenase family protein subunit M [Syntrophaceae bacterium]|nr:xanthine dehydrogenase family protein subunit M [Syntrophaceae bacterium]
MVNTHILPQEFSYHEPHTLAEAVSLLQAQGSSAKVLAGGTDLLVLMKLGKVQPRHIVSISKIPALRFQTERDGLSLGPLVLHRDLEKSQGVREKFTALFEAARSVTSVQVRNMGTLGGNICHASPAADSPPALIALGAQIKIEGVGGGRAMLLEDFFTGPGKTDLKPGEVLAEIQVPDPGPASGSAFLKLTRVAADLAKVNVAAFIQRDQEVCRECRIASGAVAPTPMRLKQAEAVLRGKRFEEALCRLAGEKAAEEIQPITDIRSTAGYRREVIKVLVRDALLQAWVRAGRA